MKSALRIAMTSLMLVLMGACGELDILEEDKDFEKTPRTTDVTLENAQPIALGIAHSVILPSLYLPLHRFLDASELPADATLDAMPVDAQGFLNSDVYARACLNGGFARYQFTRAAGEDHVPGDQVLLDYDQCMDGQGNVRNGQLRALYTKLEGLNHRFVNQGTEHCIEQLASDIGKSYETRFVSADVVNFYRRGELVELQAANLTSPEDEDIPPTYEAVYSELFSSDANVIIVNQREDALPTSLGGDDVYSLREGAPLRERCQAYERHLSITATAYEISLADGLTLQMNGSVQARSISEDPNLAALRVVDSDYSMRVTLGNTEDTYSMQMDDVMFSEDPLNGAYSLKAKGLVNSSALFGVMELDGEHALLGNASEALPASGGLNVKGFGLESVFIAPDEDVLALRVDYNGDGNGDTFPDVDETLFVTWVQLLERGFIEVGSE